MDDKIRKLEEQLAEANTKAEHIKKRLKEAKAKHAKETAKKKRARDDYQKYTIGGFFQQYMNRHPEFRAQFEPLFFDSLTDYQRKRFGLPPKEENADNTPSHERDGEAKQAERSHRVSAQ